MRRTSLLFITGLVALGLSGLGFAPVAASATEAGEAVLTLPITGTGTYTPGLSKNSITQGVTMSGSGFLAGEGAEAPNPVAAAIGYGNVLCSASGGSTTPENLAVGTDALSGSCSVQFGDVVSYPPLCVGLPCNAATLVFTYSATAVRVGTVLAVAGTCTANVGSVSIPGRLAGAVVMVPTNPGAPTWSTFVWAGNLTCAGEFLT